MANSTSKPMTVRTTDERKEDFKRIYEASGATSQHEFLGMLLQRFLAPKEINGIATNPKAIESAPNLSPEETQEILKSTFEASESNTMEEFLDNLIQKFNKPEKVIEPIEETESVKARIEPNEILLSLTPAQLYALRETVLTEGFAETQNEIIDSLNYKKPGNYYYGQISEADFELLWVRNIVFTDSTTPEEKETAIRHNMAAFIVNMFFSQLLRGKLSEVTNVTTKSLKAFIREHSEDVPSEFSVRLIEGNSQMNEMILSLTPAQLYAIRETVLTEGFAEKNNEVTDSLNPENKPFLYFGSLFEPEFQLLWIRNIVLTDEMPEEEKEMAISHNMTAFLINMFLMHLIEGKISVTSVTAKTLITFIQEQDSPVASVN